MTLTQTQESALKLLKDGTQEHRFAHHKTLESLKANGLAQQLASGKWKITPKGKKALAG